MDWPAAFENADVEFPVKTDRSVNAQRSRRRFVPSSLGPAEEDRRFASLSTDLQATELLLARLR